MYTNRKSLISLASAAVLMLLAAFAPPAHATDYTIAVEGKVTGVSDPYSLLAGTGIAVDTTFSTSYTFSDGATDTIPDDPNVGSYFWYGAPYGFAAFQLGNLTLASSNLTIGVGNNAPQLSGFDAYGVYSSLNVPTGSNFTSAEFYLILGDSSAQALTSDALPIPAPNFSAFGGSLGTIYFEKYPNQFTSVTFSVTKIEVKRTDPVTLIQGLNGNVAALMAAGVTLPADGQSLYAKLDAAKAAIQAGDTATARTKIQDFINQVNAFISTRKLTTEQGQALIDSANAILTLL